MVQGFRKEKITGEIRLNKYLSDAGVCSRREADRLIEAGKVFVDGQAAVQGMKITAKQNIVVKGQEIEREKEMILLAVHKPRGIVCTTDKRWGDETIYDLLKYPKRIFSIGRLDKDSEGLLLMTNNGDILNKIMRAGNYHEKEYLVTVDREITPQFLKKMAEGVYLKDLEVKTRPCRIELAGKNQFRIYLTQGLNRQIRRMCTACGYKVTRLVRTRIMNIELGSLKAGEYRSVTRAELAALNDQLKYSTSLSTKDKEKKAGAKSESREKQSAERESSRSDMRQNQKKQSAGRGDSRPDVCQNQKKQSAGRGDSRSAMRQNQKKQIRK